MGNSGFLGNLQDKRSEASTVILYSIQVNILIIKRSIDIKRKTKYGDYNDEFLQFWQSNQCPSKIKELRFYPIINAFSFLKI